MKIDDINLAIAEAERFIERAVTLRSKLVADDARVQALRDTDPKSWAYHYSFPKENGAVRRASIDLIRALAKMRGAA